MTGIVVERPAESLCRIAVMALVKPRIAQREIILRVTRLFHHEVLENCLGVAVKPQLLIGDGQIERGFMKIGVLPESLPEFIDRTGVITHGGEIEPLVVDQRRVEPRIEYVEIFRG